MRHRLSMWKAKKKITRSYAIRPRIKLYPAHNRHQERNNETGTVRDGEQGLDTIEDNPLIATNH